MILDASTTYTVTLEYGKETDAGEGLTVTVDGGALDDAVVFGAAGQPTDGDNDMVFEDRRFAVFAVDSDVAFNIDEIEVFDDAGGFGPVPAGARRIVIYDDADDDGVIDTGELLTSRPFVMGPDGAPDGEVLINIP